MPDTICRRCGSDLVVGPTTCTLCESEINLVCPECGFTSDTKIHADCMNAISLLGC